MSLAGNLRTMQLSDLLQWCAMNAKTGTLGLRREPIEKKLFFNRGSLFSSTSNNPRERLSQFLLRSGKITEDQLFRALIRQEQTLQPLGEVLISFGWLDKTELNNRLKLKTEESIYDCFLWNDGEFSFYDDQLPNDITVFITENLTNIVVEGARRADEWRRISQAFPSLQVTFKVDKQGVDCAELSEEDCRILDFVERGMSIAECALELHAVDFYAASYLWKLHERGLIKVDRIPQEIPLD